MTSIHTILWRCALIVGILASACTSGTMQAPSAPGTSGALRPAVSERLYFGRSIPGGGTVSDADWSGFLREVVTPRFPEGLTVWRAEGQWRNASGAVVREESFVLELVHEAALPREAAVREIIAEYQRRFRQESVLRVQGPVQVSY